MNDNTSRSVEERAIFSRMAEHCFARACMQTIESAEKAGEVLSRDEIVTRSLGMPADSFFVSFDKAYQKICSLRKCIREGDYPYRENLSPARRKWLDLTREVDKTIDVNPRWSVAKALAHILNFNKAPGHYLSYRKAVNIFNKYFIVRFMPRNTFNISYYKRL